MKYFLLRYDRSQQKLVEMTQFDDADSAVRARFDREAERAPNIEVVVLGAENEAALHRTHRRYFGATALRGLAEVG